MLEKLVKKLIETSMDALKLHFETKLHKFQKK